MSRSRRHRNTTHARRGREYAGHPRDGCGLRVQIVPLLPPSRRSRRPLAPTPLIVRTRQAVPYVLGLFTLICIGVLFVAG